MLTGAHEGNLYTGHTGSVIRLVLNPTALGFVPSMSSILRGSEVFSNFLKPIDLGSTNVDYTMSYARFGVII
jgi:hypothetical protein